MRKVSVYGKTYTIKEVKQPKLDSGEPVTGTVDLKKQEIELKQTLKKEDKLRVELHELGHALLYRIGIADAGLSEELEEIIVENYAQFITETFNLRYKK